MKVKKCPARKHCFDYKDNNCDNCEFGNEFTKLHKRIDRLKKQNETLTIQRNAWALTAKALGEKWISVEERLPEDGGMYLIYNPSRMVSKVVTARYSKGSSRWCSADACCYHEGITHWMPLPEPPKMKGCAE